jgi:hypothetical protein
VVGDHPGRVFISY